MTYLHDHVLDHFTDRQAGTGEKNAATL